MNKITVRATIKAKDDVKVWEILGIATPVRYVTINFLPVEQNNILVKVHEDAIKILRLKKLRLWKKIWKVSQICGYNRTDSIEFVNIYLPPSWKATELRSAMYWFLRYLLDEAYKDI